MKCHHCHSEFPEPVALGLQLRKWRLAHSLTMASMAKRAGVSRQTIHTVEHGLSIASREVLAAYGVRS